MMTKLMASAIVVLLCAPALADPTAPIVAPPVPARTQLNLQVAITDGNIVRTHQLFMVGDDCSEVTDEQVDHVDEIRACAHPSGGGLEVRIEWKARTGLDTPRASTSHGKSSLLVARGVTYPIGKAAVSVAIVAR